MSPMDPAGKASGAYHWPALTATKPKITTQELQMDVGSKCRASAFSAWL